VDGCTERLAGLSGLKFLHTSELTDDEYGAAFDVATCMETLEHCPEAELNRLLADLLRLVKPRGVIIISVPIEIGPTLLAKQAARRVLGWRKVGEYQHTEPYTASELLKMTFAGPETRIERPLYYGSEHPHKGFNWRNLEHRLRQLFSVEAVEFSPFSWSFGLASSQVWFVCRTPPRTT
jgi:SAM-dependent methyltransferase